GRFVASLPHEGAVRQAAFTPDARTIVTGSASWNASGRLWEMPPEFDERILYGGGQTYATALRPDGRTAVTVSHRGPALGWDLDSGRRVGKPAETRHYVNVAVFSPDGSTILVGKSLEEGGGELSFWDTRSGVATRPPIPHPSALWSIDVTADGGLILTGT